MKTLDHMTPKPKAKIDLAGVFSGAIIFPALWILWFLVSPDYFDPQFFGRDNAPIAKLIIFPFEIISKSVAWFSPIYLILFGIVYLMGIGALLGRLVVILPRRLLTPTGILVCWLTTIFASLYATFCIHRCPRRLLPIPWNNAYPEQAVAVHWGFYALFFLAFTVLLSALFLLARGGGKSGPQEGGDSGMRA